MKLRLLVFLIIFLAKNTLAADFIVTSKADSGSGTLREAITLAAANGSAEKDYIKFNLPGSTVLDRRISLTTALPLLSSNLVIDGSTQPGEKFQASDAKIQIVPGNSGFDAFVLLNIDGFELYGVYITGFANSVPRKIGFESPTAALYIENSKNIQIGAPGKGNVFFDNSYAISTWYTSITDGSSLPIMGAENLKIYSNYFGFAPDGKSIGGIIRGVAPEIALNYCKGLIEIGGADIKLRNFFGTKATFIAGQFSDPSRLFPSDYLIQNNFFGYDINGQASIIPTRNTSGMTAITLGPGNSPYSIKILDNKIQTPYSVSTGQVTGEVYFQGNILQNDQYPGKPYYRAYTGFNSTNNIKIGGENPGEGNTITGQQLSAGSPKSVLVQQTNIYCSLVPSEEIYINRSNLLPVVEIKVITSNSVSGISSPKSKIELFMDDDCPGCQPFKYFTTVLADENGNWEYKGSITSGIIATATLNGFTSLFTNVKSIKGSVLLNSSCGENNGSITGPIFQNSGGYQWTNERNEVIGNAADISNLAPGLYTLTFINASCSNPITYKISSISPSVNKSAVTITQPSCDNKNGRILVNPNNFERENFKYVWTDINGKVRAESSDLINVEAGTYLLKVSYRDCSITYGPIILDNKQGPVIDQTAAIIQNTACNTSNGSIKNIKITGTGNIIYTWKNSANVIVGNTLDLLNVPAGKYTIEVKDGSSCGPLTSGSIEVKEIGGITLDESNTKITNSTCNSSNGSVLGLVISGGTDYKWINENSQVISNKLDLLNVSAGKYTLHVSNAAGCLKQSKVFEVTEKPIAQFNVLTEIVGETCNQNNGSITVSFTGSQPKTIRWTSSSGNTLGNATKLAGISEGNYKLFLTDDQGCENLHREYTVSNVNGALLDRSIEKVTNDQCTQSKGSIKGPGLSGGKLPYSYEWKDKTGLIIGRDANLENVRAGDYFLTIGDALACSNQTIQYTVYDENSTLEDPLVKDVQICAPGETLIEVTKPNPGKYILYDNSGAVLVEDINGSFRVNVLKSSTYFIEYQLGICKSAKVPVEVFVADEGLALNNTITPNGDGINDDWILSSISNYPSSKIEIYNRYGQKVFQSRGYGTPFNGLVNGIELPSGTYYYTIELRSGCNIVKGALTIIR